MARSIAKPFRRVGIVALAVAVASALAFELGRRLADGYERWPMPEELTRDGGGRLADLIREIGR